MDLILCHDIKDNFFIISMNICYFVHIVFVIWGLHQNHNGSDSYLQEEHDQNEIENDAELNKSLNKQRRHAIASARRGRKTIASRNSYKDKGGRSSHSSKVQKQLSSW